ncbi:MAG: helix-turn-helix transcriptional regulator [Patescibacteria group bacterium]
MNSRHKEKQNIRTKKLKTYSFGDVFGKDLKSETFKNTYREEMTRLRLARQMREMRIAKKLTQKDVAEKAHMPQSVIARMESGKHSPSLFTLERIANVFDKEVQLA